jgi:hypothetical protein
MGIAKPNRRILGVEYYCYNGQIGSAATPLAPNVPQSTNIITQADSDFALTFISAGVQEAANNALVYNDNIAWQIQDTSNGKMFFNVPTVLGLTSGAGGFPFVLPAPRVINPNTTLLVTATNRDGAINPVGLFFAFHGTRIYYAS